MNRKISRRKTRCCLILAWTFIAALPLICITGSTVIMIIAAALLALFLILLLFTNRCPYYKAPFPWLFWSKPDAGYCRGCGKLLVYDYDY